MFELPSVTRKTHLLLDNGRQPLTRKIEQKAFTTHVCQAIQNRTNIFFSLLPRFPNLKNYFNHFRKE